MLKILVVGFGDLGLRLSKILTDSGHKVWGAKRRLPEKKGDFLPFSDTPVELIYLDVSMPIPKEFFIKDWDFVVITLTPSERSSQAYRQVYLQGAENIAHGFSRYNDSVRRFFWVSSTSVYSQEHGEWVNELSETSPKTETGNILLQSELAISSQLPTTVIRFSGIYGTSRLALLRKTKTLIETYLKEGGDKSSQSFYQYLLISDSSNYWTNRIHRDDCASVLAYLMDYCEKGFDNSSAKTTDTGKGMPDVVLASDKEPVSMFHVMTWLGREMNLLEGDFSSEDEGHITSKRCSSEQLQQLGFQFQYPTYREGYKSVLEQNKI